MVSLFPFYFVKVHISSFDLILPLIISSVAVVPCFFSASSSAFNIDEEYPIVITNRFDGGDAHFGASVLLLPKSLEHETDITGWVIIGAPKANCTHHANHSRIYEPGVIWRCALGPSVMERRRKLCEVVQMDPTGEYDPYDRALPYSDRKTGGWLGGSMFVGESDRFVACASRWVNKKYTDLYLVNGMCYWIPKSNLMAEKTEDPPGWPWLAPKLSYRLSPLLNGTKQAYKFTVNDTTSHQIDKTVIYDWAFGQFGFSLHLTPNNEMIVGSVGVLDWTGSLVYYRDSLGPRTQFRRYNAHPATPAFSEVFVVRPQRHNDLLQNSDYFGYSVTSGNFFHGNFSANRTQFAAGAPRSSHLSGKVLVFTVKESEEEGTRSEGILELIVEPIEGKDTSKGNHYGSYFGHSLLSLDVNGDEFDDLLVGAPLYGASVRFKRNVALQQEEEEEKGAKMKSGDEGCVFVYWSTGEDFVRLPQTLCGDKIAGARFGSAITSLKDINYDGFNDVAIGAPFENEGRGAVYIYHGGKQFLTLAQKLQPEFIDPKIRTFGWSLSLGVDIDNNGYPDLAVGAYETNQVIIFRTIPIVHFIANLTSSIPKLLTTTAEFNLTSCLSYSGHGNMPSVLGMWVKLTIQVEPEGRRIASFIHSASSSTAKGTAAFLVTSMKKLLYFRNDEMTCYNFTAVRNGTVDGITRTVPILMEYWMEGNEVGPGSTKPVHYIMDKVNSEIFVSLNTSKSEFAEFSHAKLPLPVGNKFGTNKLTLPVGTICEADGDPECLANLTLSALLVDPKTKLMFGSKDPFILGSASTLTLTIQLSNHRETANLPITLSIHLPQPPNVRRLPPNCDPVAGTANSYSCSIRRPIKEGQAETLTIELDVSTIYGESTEKHLYIYLEANTSSLLMEDCKHQFSVPMITQLQPQNFSHVNSKIEYAPGNNESILTFGISQAFEIGLGGPSAAAAVQIDFEIPRKIEIDGKFRELIGLKRPIVTYDGKISCYPVNGSFLEEGQTETATFTTVTPLSKMLENNLAQNEDYGNDDPSFYPYDFDSETEDTTSTISEVTKILLGKTRRGKRSAFSTNEANEFDDRTDQGILKISCGGSSKRKLACLRLSCIFSRFTPQKKAVVELKLKMNNKVAALLLNCENELHFEDISSLWIASVGKVQALDLKGNPFGPEGKVEFVSRLGIPPPYELPAWILIVSVAGGLLSLMMIMLILKKCGFFHRSKRDEMMRHRQAMEIKRKFSKGNPGFAGTSSTARVRTSSSRRRQNSNANNSSKRNRSFRQANESVANNTTATRPTTTPWNQIPSSMCMASPTTIAKQREIPGSVDLNELRRLYANADHNELY